MFTTLVGKLLPKNASLITLIDANATLGTITSPFAGDAEPEQQLFTGDLLHEYMVTEEQSAPATFSGGGPTWKSRRIDYVLIPQSWLPGVTSTSTDKEGLLALDCDNEDHRLTQLEVHVTASAGHSHRGSASARFANVNALRLPEIRGKLQTAWEATPPLPPSWDADAKQ